MPITRTRRLAEPSGIRNGFCVFLILLLLIPDLLIFLLLIWGLLGVAVERVRFADPDVAVRFVPERGVPERADEPERSVRLVEADRPVPRV